MGGQRPTYGGIYTFSCEKDVLLCFTTDYRVKSIIIRLKTFGVTKTLYRWMCYATG